MSKMVGKYHVKVADKTTEYEFDIERKYTFLLGDSAKGKSKLYKMLGNPEILHEVSGKKKVDILPLESRKVQYLRNIGISDVIFVVDECVEGYKDLEFKEFMESCDAYSIIIGRTPVIYKGANGEQSSLPLSVNEIYTIDTTVRSSVSRTYYSNKFSNV